MKAAEIVERLRVMYGPRPRVRAVAPMSKVFIPEFRIGTGYGKNNEQRLDAWAMELTDKMVRRAFEVKVSRSDLLSELANPRKRARALLVSNEFWFATPPGLVKPDELPLEAGLIEVGQEGEWHVVEPAPWRDTPPPTWRFVASLIRRTEPVHPAPEEQD